MIKVFQRTTSYLLVICSRGRVFFNFCFAEYHCLWRAWIIDWTLSLFLLRIPWKKNIKEQWVQEINCESSNKHVFHSITLLIWKWQTQGLTWECLLVSVEKLVTINTYVSQMIKKWKIHTEQIKNQVIK